MTSALKGYERWEFVYNQERKGKNLKEIAPLLGIKYQTLKNWMCKNRSTFTSMAAAIAQPKPVAVPKTSVSSLKGKTSPGSVQPALVDTRSWSWKRWALTFQDKLLLKHQEENLHHFDTEPTILNDPRQHGKTTFCVETFITRKLCESVFETVDHPILYTTNSKRNARRMVNAIKHNLVNNPKITANYGELIDYSMMGRQVTVSQNMYEINLITLKNKQLCSFEATTVGERIRGGNFWWVIIDDPIDVREDLDYEEKTIAFMDWFQLKIMELLKYNMLVIGTRYDINDLYVQLEDIGIFKHLQRKAIIGTIPAFNVPERKPGQRLKPTDIEVKGPIQLLAPVLWRTQPKNPIRCGTPAQNILFVLHSIGDRNFQREYQNDPIPLNPTIKYEWLIPFSVLPNTVNHMKWVCSVDTATGETKAADYNAFVFIGYYEYKFYLMNILTGKWSPVKRMKKLEKFILDTCQQHGIPVERVKLLTEVVRTSGSDFYQYLRDDSPLTPIKINPVGRGDKPVRITNNLATKCEGEKVYIHVDCNEKRKLKDEMDSFPGKHEHILDAADQGVYYFGNKPKVKRNEVPSPTRASDDYLYKRHVNMK